jgi:predicted transcriptional regulator
MEPTQTAIEESRVALGVSIRELAREAGVDHTYLSRYERGEVTPSRSWLRRVALAIGDRVASRYQENA